MALSVHCVDSDSLEKFSLHYSYIREQLKSANESHLAEYLLHSLADSEDHNNNSCSDGLYISWLFMKRGEHH